MKLDSIFATNEGKNSYPIIEEKLKERFNVKSLYNIKRSDVFEWIDCERGYGRNTYRGKIKNEITLTEIELALIVDNGYSFFGGRSEIYPDKEFEVVIWTD